MVGAGYSYLRQYCLSAGEANLREKRVSLVGIGRMALAYPDIMRDWLANGKVNPKKVC